MSKTIWPRTCFLLDDISPWDFVIVASRPDFQVVRRWRYRQVSHCKHNKFAAKRRGRSVSNCLESLNRRWSVRCLQEVWSNTSRPVSQRVSPRPRHVSLRLRVMSTLKTLNRPSRPSRFSSCRLSTAACMNLSFLRVPVFRFHDSHAGDAVMLVARLLQSLTQHSLTKLTI